MPVPPLPRPTLVVGTRGSALARWQSEWVAAQLQRAWPGLEVRFEIYTTTGDRVIDKPLPEIGGKGLFTAELEAALRAGAADIAVHSLKDLPVEPPAGLVLGAIPAREDVRDVLIAPPGVTLATLPAGARIGTSSPRRAAQLRAYRADFRPVPIRGNVDTRVRKGLGGTDCDAALLAAAGVNRLGLGDRVAEILPLAIMLPAPGQGAVAVQCRADDAATLALLRAIDDPATRACVTAERCFLEKLGGGCSAPIAAHATISESGEIKLTGLVAAVDGSRVVRVAGAGTHAEELGARLAREAVAAGAERPLA